MLTLAFTHTIQKAFRLFSDKPSVGQRGQGLIEYLLLLVLTVAIIMALSKGVGRPLQKYLQANVLDVVGCMLRVGEFPSQSLGQCFEYVQLNLDLSELQGGGNNSGGSNGSSGSQSESQSGSGSEKSTTSNNKTSSNSKNNSNASTSDDESNRNRSSQRRKTQFKKSSSGGALSEGEGFAFEDGTKDKVIKLNTETSGGSDRADTFYYDESDVGVYKIPKTQEERIQSSFKITKNKDGQEELEQQEASSRIVSQTDFSPLSEPSESSFIVPKKRKPAQSTDVDLNQNWSFFAILKWGLIIGILVIFLVFMASQLNSIRKGWTD